MLDPKVIVTGGCSACGACAACGFLGKVLFLLATVALVHIK